MEEKTEKKIALLIDAENVSCKYVKLILDEISSYGVVTYKRLYGDFQASSVKAWLKDLQEYAITPVFQYNYTHGKNASDSAMIIDAMDILYSGHVDGFCIVTSDSDFTKLVLRLREAGMTVVGMGEEKTPVSLVSACEAFKFLDILYQRAQEKPPVKKAAARKKKEAALSAGASAASGSAAGGSGAASAAASSMPQAPIVSVAVINAAEDVHRKEEVVETAGNIPSLEEVELEVTSIIDIAAGEDGWVDLSALGESLPKRIPGFDPRNYGVSKLRQFIELFDSVELKQLKNAHNPALSTFYVRIRPKEEEEEKVKEPAKARKRRSRRGGKGKKKSSEASQ